MARRLWMLSRLEALNVALVPACVVVSVRTFGGVVGAWTVVGLALVSLVLAEGALYWWARHDQFVRRDPRLMRRAMPLLARAKRINEVAITLVGLAWVVRWVTGASIDQDRVVGASSIAVAVLEHINYFHRQLMHDTRNDLLRLRRDRRLRRSHLSRDLERYRRTAG